MELKMKNMSEILKYGNHTATLYFSAEDELFHGKVMGINDLVTFEADTMLEMKNAFADAVEDYLETCKELNRQPEIH